MKIETLPMFYLQLVKGKSRRYWHDKELQSDKCQQMIGLKHISNT